MSDYKQMIAGACEQLPRGAFLTVSGNPMTIGWAQFGVVWGRPVVTVLVRKSRYTHDLLEHTDRFTISVPASGAMQEQLTYCGRHSGRDGDKAAACGLTLSAPVHGGAERVDGCALYFECRIVERTEMDMDRLDADVKARSYGDNQATPDGDPHTVYFAELLGADMA